MGGEGTPRSDLPAQLFGVIVRAVLFVAGGTLLLGLVALGIAIFRHDPEPSAADKFGCTRTYINARGEDTGECQ